MNDKQIIVKKDGKITAYITKEDLVYDAWIEERQNKESRLIMNFSNQSSKLFVVNDCNNEFYVDGKVFTLLNPDALCIERTSENKILTTLTAVERWQAELETDYEKVYNSTTGFDQIDEHMVIIVSGGSDLSNGKYRVGSAGHALYALLQGTDWILKECNVSGTFDLETDKKSTLSNIYAIQELWGGIIIWDSVNRTVSLMDEELYSPFHGFQIKYGTNLKNISKEVDYNVISRLYVYGEQSLNIASVNGGKEYLDNFTYTSKIRKSIITNPDIAKPQSLKEWGLRQSKLLGKPKETYKTSIIDLSTLDEYNDISFTVNDMCDVIDTSIVGDNNIMRKRIVYKKYNVFNPCLCELEIGDNQTTLEQELKHSMVTSSSVGESRNSINKWDGYLDASQTKQEIYTVNEDWVTRLSNAEENITNLVLTTNKNKDDIKKKVNKNGEFYGSVKWNENDYIQKSSTGIDINSSDTIKLNGVVSLPVGVDTLKIGDSFVTWKQITYKNASGVDETGWILTKIEK